MRVRGEVRPHHGLYGSKYKKELSEDGPHHRGAKKIAQTP